jgi:hypothetical protein
METKLEIKKGVARPANLPMRSSGGTKYPVEKMEVDDYFEVPKEMYFGDAAFDAERYDGKRHRERVNSAVRGWALKQNKAASTASDFDPSTFKPYKFTIALLENGNVGVWRDQ